MREPLEVAATVDGHWLTEPVVYSFSQSWKDYGVRGQYHIYSSREIDRAEFILDGDTLTGIYGTTPVLFAADPDTIDVYSVDYMALSEPKAWKITVWDKLDNRASDSGISQFAILYPGISIDGGSNNVGEEIAFPLILHGTTQQFGIAAYNVTLTVDLNPAGEDSVVYQDIEQLADQIMDQLSSNDSWRTSTNIFGETGPLIYVTAAVSRQTGSTTNRIVIANHDFGMEVGLVALDGNSQLLQALGFTPWKQKIPANNLNFYLDPEVYERYRGW